MKNKLIYKIIPACVGLLSACVLILFACNGNPQISVFFRKISLLCSRYWGLLWGLSPIPAPELMYIVLPIVAAVLLYFAFWRKKSGALWIISMPFILFFLFTMMFAVHYSAPPLSHSLGFAVEKYSQNDLADTMEKLIQEMNIYAPKLNRDSTGTLIFQNYDQSIDSVAEGYKTIAEKHHVFKPMLTAPKPRFPLFSSKIMSYIGISGYFFPFTATPMVSLDTTATQLPYTVAHEWAHAGGIGPEDECNFAAFLVCNASNDPYLRYSAVFNAYIYVGNALYADNPNRAKQLISTLNPLCITDIRTLNEHLHQYETPIQDVGNAINDAYIKSTGQPNGLQSYGKMVDLLISYYKTL